MPIMVYHPVNGIYSTTPWDIHPLIEVAPESGPRNEIQLHFKGGKYTDTQKPLILRSNFGCLPFFMSFVLSPC